jgi:uncharacterized Zn-finger protein
MQPPDLYSSVPPPPEIIVVRSKRVACDGGGGALGHPLVYMEMGEESFVECGYCDRRFELAPGADGHGHETEFADPAAFEPDEIE